MNRPTTWRDIVLRPADLDVQFHRSGGPGGQHRNKVETAVRIVHLPTGIVVTATENRSQSQNRAAAMDRLRKRLWERAQPVKPRVATRPSRGAREERLQIKKRQSERKASRRTGWDD